MVTTAAVIGPASASPDDRYTVDVVTDESAFFGLESEWNDAVDRAGFKHPFLRHEWFRTWWECFGSGSRPHIVIVRDADRISGIAPLMLETTWMCGMPARRLRLMHNDHSPRADFVVTRPGNGVYRAIWDAITSGDVRWDVLQLGQLPRESETTRAIHELAKADGLNVGVWPSGSAPYATLAGTWDAFLNGRTAKFRQNLRNRISRLSQKGEPVLESIEDPARAIESLGDVFHLEASDWKEDAGSSIAAEPDVRRFYTLLAARAARHGWLRLLFLAVGDRRIATAYGAQYANRLFLIKTGYDPSHAQCSPFKLLAYFAVRDGYERGLSEVDFLGDTEPWKLEWTATARPHDWLFVFGGSSRARLLHRAKFQVVPALKRLRG